MDDPECASQVLSGPGYGTKISFRKKKINLKIPNVTLVQFARFFL